MSSPQPYPYGAPAASLSSSNQDVDDAEKGIYVSSTQSLPESPPSVHLSEKALLSVEALPSPLSPVHEGITPSSSVPILSITGAVVAKPSVAQPAPTKPAQPKKKQTSRWTLFRLWFNTYRQFFIFITTLNLVGMILAGVGPFHYAQNHIGALVLGNLLFAVLMRNELLLRILYTIAIYGLRSVSACSLGR
jgi:hypothetical protein